MAEHCLTQDTSLHMLFSNLQCTLILRLWSWPLPAGKWWCASSQVLSLWQPTCFTSSHSATPFRWPLRCLALKWSPLQRRLAHSLRSWNLNQHPWNAYASLRTPPECLRQHFARHSLSKLKLPAKKTLPNWEKDAAKIPYSSWCLGTNIWAPGITWSGHSEVAGAERWQR